MMTKTYYAIFNFIALAAIIFLAVDSLYGVVMLNLGTGITSDISIKQGTKKQDIKKVPLSSYGIIADRNLFSKVEVAPEPEDSVIDDLDETSLNIALMGTIFGDQETSAAIIEDKTKRSQGLYMVGDLIQNAVVRKILRGKVILRVGIDDEILTMDEPPKDGSPVTGSAPTGRTAPPPPTASAGSIPERTITMRREDIDNSLANINELMTQAAVSPHFTNGRADGLAITRVQAGSIFRRMDLRSGDIVTGVSGKDIQTPEDLIGLYNDLLSQDEVEVKILRRGGERIHKYRFR